MRVLFIICLMVSAAVALVQLFNFAVLFTSATFFLVVIDFHCSVVILWKIRKEQELSLSSPGLNCGDEWSGEEDCRGSDTSSGYGTSPSISPFYQGSDDQVKNGKMSPNPLLSDGNISSKVLNPFEENDPGGVDKHLENVIEEKTSEGDNESENKDVCLSKCLDLDLDWNESGVFSRNGEVERETVVNQGFCREMFPLGACIVVLAVYLITKRKFYLDEDLLQPETTSPSPTLSQNNSNETEEEPSPSAPPTQTEELPEKLPEAKEESEESPKKPEDNSAVEETSNSTTEAITEEPEAKTEESESKTESSNAQDNPEAEASPCPAPVSAPSELEKTPEEQPQTLESPSDLNAVPTPPPPPPPPPEKPEKPHSKHGGKRRGSHPRKVGGQASVLERFSSVLNKAQQSKVTPLPHSQQSLQTPRKSSVPSAIMKDVSGSHMTTSSTSASTTPTPPVDFSEEPKILAEVVEEESKSAQVEVDSKQVSNEAEVVVNESESTADNYEKEQIPEEEVVNEKEAVEESKPTRDPPIIELLDVLKGDTTSRAIRITSGVLISKRYLIEKEIGRGGFSKVYLGTDQKTQRKVAIKTASRLLNQTKSLKRELGIYEDLQSNCSNLSIPYLIHYTEIDIKRTSVLVMDLLGPSLELLFETCNCKFSMGTVAFIMYRLLDILSYIHFKTYIHRDIKPENILIGRLGTPDAGRIFLIDFGVVSNWCNTLNGKHVRQEYGVARLGTNSYMSLNASRGKTQSRKDDLEALGYCMFRFLKVNFPWSRYDDMNDGIKGVITYKMKSEMVFEEEFPPTQYPKEVPEYLQYVRELGFETKPDYDMLKDKFRELGERLKGEGAWDGELEWMKSECLEKLKDWIIPD